MKSISISVWFALLLPLVLASFLGHQKVNNVPANFKKIAYVNSISSLYGPQILESLGVYSSCYDIIILTFWMPEYVADALNVWANIHSYLGTNEYGSTNSEVQAYILDTMHANNKQLFISAFGATGNPSGDPIAVAEQLATFINSNPYIDGVDIDYEDNQAVLNGDGIEYIITFQKALSAKVHKNLLFTHAPQAPYFSRKYYGDKGYYKVEQEIGDLIAWYNVQFYNEGSDRYDTYESLFVESPEPFVNTAYKEILEINQLPLSKLVLGKPASPADASNTGYIEPQELGKICLKAKEKLGYDLPGFFIWQLKSDARCEFANAFLESYFPGYEGHRHSQQHGQQQRQQRDK